MLPHSIQHRIILFFVLLILLIMTVSGWLLHWMVRQSLEAELGHKLMAVANAASVQFDAQEIGFLMQGVGRRSQTRMRQRLLDLMRATRVKRIYLFDRDGKSLLDTDEQFTPGTTYFNLRFFQRETERVASGESAYTILFEGIDGQPTMTGYAPLTTSDGPVGGIGVDGSVPFLGAVNNLRTRLYTIGIVCMMAAVVIGILLARTITRPIEKLVRVSHKIGRGDYSEPVPQQDRGEIGLLTQTMEEMRKGIVDRERELKAMLAGVAHEIRNPLGGIELFTGLLADDVPQDSDARKHVQRISKEIVHLKDIVESFLTYARPQEPHREVCDLEALVAEAAQLVKDQTHSRNITVSLGGDAEKTRILADPGHLKRIFLNLIYNAVQAQPGGGRIDISWKEAGGAVFVCVKDGGEGIPREIQDNVFDPFFTTREKGTGLGLSIVKGLIEVNGGSIRLARSDTNGTEFEIRLPEPPNE